MTAASLMAPASRESSREQRADIDIVPSGGAQPGWVTLVVRDHHLPLGRVPPGAASRVEARGGSGPRGRDVPAFPVGTHAGCRGEIDVVRPLFLVVVAGGRADSGPQPTRRRALQEVHRWT